MPGEARRGEGVVPDTRRNDGSIGGRWTQATKASAEPGPFTPLTRRDAVSSDSTYPNGTR